MKNTIPPIHVVYFDLIELKAINACFGHEAGDKVLIHAANIFRAHAKGFDVVGRVGADEFGVYVTGIGRREGARLAERLTKAINSNPPSWEGRTIPVRVISATYTTNAGDDASSALAGAEREVYRRRYRSYP